MNIIDRLTLFTPMDYVAVSLLFITWYIVGWLVEHPPKRYPSVTVLTIAYRIEWMEQMITREPRVFDAITMNGLRQGTAFFGSGVMIAIGAVLALMSNAQTLDAVAADLSASAQVKVLWQIKLLVVAGLLTHAFLKFVWANRLFGYCAVAMAATPNDISDPRTKQRARQAADISNRAAINFNRGLRSVYFALAGVGWLVSPYALFVTTAIAAFTTLSREFASTSRETLREE